MAYSTSLPPVLMADAIGGGYRTWQYKSTDAPSVVRVAGYFTNGWLLGMRKGDVVHIIDTDASPITLSIAIVSAASSTSVDLSDGTAITATNSD